MKATTPARRSIGQRAWATFYQTALAAAAGGIASVKLDLMDVEGTIWMLISVCLAATAAGISAVANMVANRSPTVRDAPTETVK